MSTLPFEVIEMIGQTMMKVVPITIGLALFFTVLDPFLGLQSRQAVVAQARARHRHLLLVLRAGVRPRAAHRAAGGRRGRGVQRARRRRARSRSTRMATVRCRSCRCGCSRSSSCVASDFMLYWLHRMFHGGGFWKYHAIHHSSEDLEWISAARFHPVNLLIGTITVDVILLMAGISPNIMLWVGPFTTFHSAFVHANLNWTLGPFKYVIATPVFHRWHHTAARRGRRHQFRGHVSALGYPVRHLPHARRQVLSGDYGVDAEQGHPVRRSAGQLAYPFRQ